MTFRPHQRSDKTPEELAAQRARRLQNRIARALLKQDDAGDTAVDAAIQTLRDTLKDPKERRATKDNAALGLLREANKAAGNLPQFTLQQGITLDAAALLRAVAPDGLPVPNSTSDVSSVEQPRLPIPTADLMAGLGDGLGDHCPPKAVVIGTAEPTDDPPDRVRSGPASAPTPDAPRQPEPARAQDDPMTRCPACHARTDDEPHDCPVPEEE